MAGGKDKQISAIELAADGLARGQLPEEANSLGEAEMAGVAFERCPPAASPNEGEFEIPSSPYTLADRIDEHIGSFI